MTKVELKQLIKEVAEEEVSMSALRQAVSNYKQRQTSPEISKKTGEPVRTKSVIFPGYNISDNDIPFNVKTFYNNFKKSLNVYNLKPSEISKQEILNVLDKILTLNEFK